MDDAEFLWACASNLEISGIDQNGDYAARLRRISERLSSSISPRSPAFDPVARPEHYAKGAVEHIDGFEAACAAGDRGLPPGVERFLGGCEHNATKYLWRAGAKLPGVAGVLQDWKKAAWYVARGIARLEREGK